MVKKTVPIVVIVLILGIVGAILASNLYLSDSQPLTETSTVTSTVTTKSSTLTETTLTSKQETGTAESVREGSASNIARSPFGTDLSDCSTGDNRLSSPPLPLESSYMLEPMGRTSGLSGHITPTDHLYIYLDVVDDELHDVLAVASGYIIQIDRSPDEEGIKDYRMVFEHSCTLFTYYIHIQEIHPDILKESGELSRGATSTKRIPVDSGQVIGRIGELKSYQRIANQSNLDFALIDTEVTLPGFVIPSHYTEMWKVHTVDPFDYYDEPLRSQLLERTYRDDEPRGGKIDFDIDGKLVGNWFLDGTEDYFAKGIVGKSEAEWENIYGRDVGECRSEYWDTDTGESIEIIPCNYWMGHLSFSYHHILSDMVTITTGIFWDLEGGINPPWGVKNNSPDPASIDVESGLVKYKLVRISEGLTGLSDHDSQESDRMIGILLVQMIDDRTIKVEVFLGKSSEEVYEFSENVQIYRR